MTTNWNETDFFSLEQEKIEMMQNVTFISLSGVTEYRDLFECGISPLLSSPWQRLCGAVILRLRGKGDSYLDFLFNLKDKHC